jgi:hypothetical protein
VKLYYFKENEKRFLSVVYNSAGWVKEKKKYYVPGFCAAIKRPLRRTLVRQCLHELWVY